MMDTFDLSLFKEIVAVSMPSIVIDPSTRAKRNIAAIKDDLPAPVLPTIPI